MKSATNLGIGILALASAGSPAASMQRVAPHYLLSMQIYDGDQLVGSPRITIAAGQPATVEIGNSPSSHYYVTMTATAQSSDKISIKSKMDVVSGGVRQAASPHLLVALDETSSVAFGTQSATSKPIRVNFTLHEIP